jgi:hypothetical protein
VDALILAVDPGADLGWATFGADTRELERAGLGRSGMPPPAAVSALAIERPRIYPQRGQKGDPNDLITLAIIVGRVEERYERAAHVEITPHTWKHTLSKEHCARQILRTLTAPERATLRACLEHVVEGKQHNVIDAVGIGLFYLTRFYPGR